MNFKYCVSGSVDTSIKIWKLNLEKNIINNNNICLRTLTGHSGAVFCLQFNESFICSGSEDKSIRIWRFDDAQTSTPLRVLKGHVESVVCLQFDNYKLVSGSGDKSIR